MGWPPQVGELLPRADEPLGVRDKLTRYSLNRRHHSGGPKARAFELILGITPVSIEYLAAEIELGILGAPIIEVRPGRPSGFDCAVDFQVRGLGSKRRRLVRVRTAWHLAVPLSPPHLTSAYVKP
jgi:hypothetical protein